MESSFVLEAARKNEAEWNGMTCFVNWGVALRRIDIVVIGGGQAGLSTGYYLSSEQQQFIVLDQSHEVGYSWSSRYDSLTLFTPRMYSSLPGLPLEGDPWGYPTKDEMAAYLQQYQEKFAIPIQLETEVTRLTYQLGDSS